MKRRTSIGSVAGILTLLASVTCGTAARAQTVNVCATIPDFGSLVQEIGGNQVSLTVFAKPTEDPHFLDARPSFVKAVSQADLLVHGGMQLESGWLPAVLQGARNANILAGGRGNVDCSTVIQPLEVPQGRVDRSMGDVHPGGNPHYWTDPLSGLKIAALIRDKLSEVRPDQKTHFEDRYDAFAKRLGSKMIGDELVQQYGVENIPKLALLFQHGKLEGFLKEQKHDKLLGGWFGQLLPHLGAKIVDDHNMWPYFARTFGLKVVAHMEPKPGIAPTTQHLASVVEMMKREKVRVILASAYYDPRHARFVATQTGARVVSAANLAGARPGTEDYLAAVDHNVRELVKAFQAGQAAP